ncbi:type II toxin-antitoxin system RelE/ParE family toxin [Spirosoma foliorum]|uniref:Type II toxin-antitoxin system RelE/ParE family toxin n=1 Tax=Spirosoma foliorum TaxID=2710596 RepID=A0A7G5GR67_9BACT|nr:type II toxin-antitoxin system RelE/ParE family toxin [Spirosoma foliorum]QMW01359.1 type II toxin-antitoxin system RelE/ParE family toxin [Spirosoma foliorum]
MVNITFTNRAVADLDAIGEYHAHYSPGYASHLQDAIIDKTGLLRQQPEMGRKVPEFDLPYLRELIHKSYRIVYKIVSPNQIDIITIQHSSRNLSERFFDAE